MRNHERCPDCDSGPTLPLNRRQFVQAVGGTAVAAGLAPGVLAGESQKSSKSESLVAKLYQSLTPEQRAAVCFDWDYKDERGVLRTHVSNNWTITDPTIGGNFFNADQKDMIEAIFWGLYNPEWHDRIKKQLRDDAGGYGKRQSIAIFGKPGEEKFEFVMTGRHLTIRCDGNTTDHAAFGGPIFYGHAAQGFNEKPDHPGNVFWPQALKANKLYEMLGGAQRKQALVPAAPPEEEVHFRGKSGGFQGLPVSELSADQLSHLDHVLHSLIEPYRQTDQAEVLQCLKAQGGLEKCAVAFYESDDVGKDGVWDTWRLEGPAFVWHYRGDPHVHVWVNVADDPSFRISTSG